ncbi:unnamed protein product [Arctia plantaginis]|uniref:Uncharacterized protein n=1 Tax=Arctia plantaginis TaxID=874455 RepID=A0A8S0YUA4_ARCPL|nr:unnamed protein product [Arctia plantaginis]
MKAPTESLSDDCKSSTRTCTTWCSLSDLGVNDLRELLAAHVPTAERFNKLRDIVSTAPPGKSHYSPLGYLLVIEKFDEVLSTRKN